MDISFLGATREVTGSCCLLRAGRLQILVDCGLIQGSAEHERHNRQPFPFEPADIDAVVLTHAHLDHSGRLPLLVKQGFGGRIFTHRATVDLCAIGTVAVLGVSADSFLMAVAIAASCAFLTPVGHQNNKLILGPGGRRFGDYWRLGLPVEVLVVVVSVPLLLIVWPL